MSCQNILNVVSADIKECESFLASRLLGDVEMVVSGSEFIKWDHSSKRIQYHDGTKLRFLLECPVPVRVEGYSLLGGFVRHAMEDLNGRFCRKNICAFRDDLYSAMCETQESEVKV